MMVSHPLIALIPNDPVGERMAGPGIRYWEFARVLGQHFTVELIIPPYINMPAVPESLEIPATLRVCKNISEFREAVAASDIIITLGVIVFLYPFLAELGKPLVLDIYNPFLLEGLQRDVTSDQLARWTTYESDLNALRQQLSMGDFFVCASERQRDYWLGMLSAVGRVNPLTHQQDSTLRHLIDVAPFGLPSHPPVKTQTVLKGVYPGIEVDDQVILWAGGIWNWLDPLSIIQAMPRILQKMPKVKLFFMGTKRPSASKPNLKAVEDAVQLSAGLGLLDHHVFFNDWVAYENRQNFLLEADVGISLHLRHIETRFSFRTRLLDHLWTGLPTIATQGDVLAETLEKQGLARLVAAQDVEGIAQAALVLLNAPGLRASLRPRFAQLAASYQWEVVSQPLLAFCRTPYIAPDRGEVAGQHSLTLLYKIRRALQLGGPAGLIRQVKEYARFWLGRE